VRADVKKKTKKKNHPSDHLAHCMAGRSGDTRPVLQPVNRTAASEALLNGVRERLDRWARDFSQ
jgi:hypothetical protein